MSGPYYPEDDFVDDEEMTEEDMAGEECGRWDNGRLTRSCMKAGSEECDWVCPYRATLYAPTKRQRQRTPHGRRPKPTPPLLDRIARKP